MTMSGLRVSLHGNNVPEVSKRFELQQIKMDLPSDVDEIPPDYREGTPVFEYVRGDEMALQRKIASLDTLVDLSFWLHASAGESGDSALGFTRSLRREFPAWTIRLVIFEASWPLQAKLRYIYRLSQISGCELELCVKSSGAVTVSRIMESAPPDVHTSLDQDLPWIYEAERVVQTVDPVVRDDHLLVDISGVTSLRGQLWSFVGRIRGTSQRVVGVVAGPLSNVVSVHKDAVMDISDMDPTQVPHALVHAIVGLALGNLGCKH